MHVGVLDQCDPGGGESPADSAVRRQQDMALPHPGHAPDGIGQVGQDMGHCAGHLYVHRTDRKAARANIRVPDETSAERIKKRNIRTATA